MTTTALTGQGLAQAQDAPSFAFTFDDLTVRMRALAAAEYTPITFKMPDRFSMLDYDAYRRIQFRPERGKWAEIGAPFQLQAFHMGWLFAAPVTVFEVDGGNARQLLFSADDFEYHSGVVEAASEAEFPGIAGFRLNYPLNSTQTLDELVSFLGASYFRALGRHNIYGLSARGLVINSWLDRPEEFPRFSEFYIEKPTGGDTLVMYAALESQSVTGAYRFEIKPGNDSVQETVIDVTARLFFRADIKELGIAPLTSMFLYADNNRAGFDDFRPQVHDSSGLIVEDAEGNVMWRPLNNAATLGNSYLSHINPRAFGLYQRERNFESYQDAGAHYERRPSVRIEPVGDWGPGNVRLIESPSKLEADDNIGAFWISADPVKAGQEREYHYVMRWGDLNPDPNSPLAHVHDTRGGLGGVSGVANAHTLRKFVVDFKGGELEKLDGQAQLDIVANVTGGQLMVSTLSKIDANNVWRLVLDVETNGPGPLELKAYILGLGKKLTETWVYQWRAAA
jgi:glucans biosynthesis protein